MVNDDYLQFYHLIFSQFRNQYDNDVATWSPQGRIHQIEYAMEAVKQVGTCIEAVLTIHKQLDIKII